MRASRDTSIKVASAIAKAAATIPIVDGQILVKGYHRTRQEINAFGIRANGARANRGMYGKGFYMTRTLAAQKKDKMRQYGLTLLECVVDVKGFICFDQAVAKKVWGSKHTLADQIFSLPGQWGTYDKARIERSSALLEKLWANPKAYLPGFSSEWRFYSSKERVRTSACAVVIANDLRLWEHCPGIVYTGSADGPCVVAYDSKRVVRTIRYCNAPTGKKVGVLKWHEMNDDLLKRRLGLHCEQTPAHVRETRMWKKMLSNGDKLPTVLVKLQARYTKLKTAKSKAVFLEVWAVMCEEQKGLRRLAAWLVKQENPTGILSEFSIEPPKTQLQKASSWLTNASLKAKRWILKFPAHLKTVLRSIVLRWIRETIDTVRAHLVNRQRINWAATVQSLFGEPARLYRRVVVQVKGGMKKRLRVTTSKPSKKWNFGSFMRSIGGFLRELKWQSRQIIPPGIQASRHFKPLKASTVELKELFNQMVQLAKELKKLPGVKANKSVALDLTRFIASRT